MDELTEERLTEMERYATNDPWGIPASDILTLVAEIRRLREVENEREEARGLAREYLYALWEEESEAARKAAREKEAQFHPWLLEPEPATTTGVAEAVFGTITEVDSDSGSSSGWVKGGEEKP